jgi:hypothetical protein
MPGTLAGAGECHAARPIRHRAGWYRGIGPAKQMMTGVSPEIRGHSLEIAQGQIVTDKGIGIDLVLRFLEKIPGINENTVRQYLAILKSSGDYAGSSARSPSGRRAPPRHHRQRARITATVEHLSSG